MPGFKKNGKPLIVDLILSRISAAVAPLFASTITFLSTLNKRYHVIKIADVTVLPI